MAISIASISKGTQIRAPRILVLGVEKIGKTTFSCGSRFAAGRLAEVGLNQPIVIPCKGEEGTDALDVPVFPPASSFGDVMDCISSLFQEEHSYRTVVIDSASALEPLVWDAVCRRYNVDTIEKAGHQGGGFGKGYGEAAQSFREITEGLDALRATKNMASIIIGHVKVKRFDDPGGDSYDTYMFDVNEKVANVLFRWADLILFCGTKVVVKKEDQGFNKEKHRGVDLTGGQRFLFTQKRPAHPGGGRGIYGQLPYELPLDWAAFEAAVAEAAKQ